MLFNSYQFIFAFLPLALLVFYTLNQTGKYELGKWWLFLASLFFYSFWTIHNLPILLLSILTNFVFGQKLATLADETLKKKLLYAGLIFNIALLSFFKYADHLPLNLNLFLPLGISFFTIQQVAYLVDTYQGVTKKKAFIDYALFVSLFTHVTAGPIGMSQDLFPQLESSNNKLFNADKLAIGIFVFTVGLFKKVIIADTFSTWAAPGFNSAEALDFFAAWKTSLSYTFQLYFDFCGYSEMAMGLGYMLNLNLAQNFNSPFKSKGVIEFWTRWHMSLSKFITTYLFTPLVRLMPKMTFRYVMFATFISMVIVGIWHGAGWTFALYGAAHGLALVINHNWKKKKKKMPGWLAWFITFNFINLSFVLFRASSISEAMKIYMGMLGLTGVTIPKILIKSVGPMQVYGWKMGTYLKPEDYAVLAMIIGSLVVVKYARNLIEMLKDFRPTPKFAVLSATLFVICLFGLNRVTEFIYLKF